MSATGRGTTRDPKDFYATPWPAFYPMLDYFPKTAVYYEPCAGDGRVIQWHRANGNEATGSDLFPQMPKEASVMRYYDPQSIDFLKDETPRDFITTNPPFSVAFEMCQHARRVAKHFAFLLRLSFLESDERGEWFEKNEPNGLFVLKKRPSFVMSITCKSVVREKDQARICKHNWMLPIESDRPKICPVCGGTTLAISTSDSSGYAWYYWGDYPALQGIHHI